MTQGRTLALSVRNKSFFLKWGKNMRKEMLLKQIIVVMIIGLFLGSSGVPTMAGTPVSKDGAGGHPLPLDAHDVAVTNISVANPVYKGEGTPVTATIHNAGSSDETSVPVNFTLGVSAASSEGFENYAPMPKGWTLTRSCPSSTWFIYNSTYTQYPKVQETAASGLAQDEWLISPTIDCSAMTNTTIRLYFTKYWYVTTGSDSNLTVLGSIDNGATWTKVMYYWAGTTYNSTTVNTTSWWITSWAAGQSNVKIAFRFRSTADTTLTDYFYFDYFFFGQNWGPVGDTPPAGWTIQNYGSETPQVWNQNDWYRYWYGTGASYSGYLARFSSAATPTETTQDEWLITPTLDCSALTNVMLRFAFYFSYSTAGVFYVNGSIDGGTTWNKSIARYTASLTSSYPESMFDISSWAAGHSNVKIRFRYYKTGTSSSYGYLDNVRVYSGSTYLLNQKFEGINGYASNFDYFLSDLTDAWGVYNWKQTPVNYNTKLWNYSAYDQFFSVTSGSSPTCSPHGGTHMVQYYGYMAASGLIGRFYSAPLNINGLKQLKFWMYHDTTSGAGKAQVQASTDGFTWTNLSTAINRQAGTAGWVQHTIDLSAYYTTPTVQIGISCTSDYNANMFFDDFTFYSDDVANTTRVTKYVDVTSGQSVTSTYRWIPTREGISKITVLAGPVPGETNLADNSMNRSITVSSVPNIWINPSSFSYTIQRGGTCATQALTIGNNGTALLTGTIAKSQTWITLSTASVSVVAGTNMIVNVDINGTLLPGVGNYSGTLTITTNDPDESPLYITVSVHVTPADHDVAVTNLAFNNPAHLLETNPITATIANNGLSNETAVPVTIQVTTQLNESFESVVPGHYMMPAGWTTTTINPSSQWYIYVSGTYPTATTYPRVAENNTNPQDEWLISPVIDCSALPQVSLLFTKYLYLATGTNTSVRVLGSTNGGSTWSQTIYNWTVAGTNSTAVAKDISSWAAGQANVKIAFRFISPGGATHGDYFYIDDFTIAKVSTTFSYDFESTWGPYGDVPPAGWTITTNETPITWDNNNWHKYSYGGTQLNVARVYYSPVRYQNESLISPGIDCSALSTVTLKFWHYFYYYSALSNGWVEGSTDGGTTWPFMIAHYQTVSDGPAIKVYDITSWAHNQPNVKIRFHYQDHDGEYWAVDDVWIGASTTAYNTPFNAYLADNWGPLGWQQAMIQGSASGNKFTAMSSGTSPTCSPHQGTKMIQYNAYSATAGNQARLYSAALNLPSPRTMKFWMFHDSVSYQTNNDSLRVQVSLDNITWATVGGPFYRSCTLQGLPLVDAWAQHTIDLSAYSSYSTIYVAFLAYSAFGNNIYFDDMTLEYGPNNSSTTYTTTIDLIHGATGTATFSTWMPTYTGYFKVTASAGPVSGETLTSDNTMAQYFNVVAFADITFAPSSFFDIFVDSYTLHNETLVIGNIGHATLTGSITGLPAWLTATPSSFSTGVGSTTPITLTLNGVAPGWYNTTITVNNNDPDENPTLVPYSAHVVHHIHNNILTVNHVGHGHVIKDPDYTGYDYGAVVQLTAIPDTGWLFDHWEGDVTGTANPASITMFDDKTTTAVFIASSGYTITVTIEGLGNVTKSPDQPTYTYGDNVTLTAVPDTGWLFQEWKGDASGTTTPTTITITGYMAVTANFTIAGGLNLNIAIVGSGNVVKNPYHPDYFYGDIVELTAEPAIGWVFDHWEGDLTGTENPETVTMTSTMNITAVFTITTGYTLTVNVVGLGSVDKVPDLTSYDYDTMVQLTANPTPGWAFNHWEGDLTGSANPATISLTGSKTVTAVFTITTGWHITITTIGSGSVNKDPEHQTYTYGDVVKLTAIPAIGWLFDHWEGDLIGTTNPENITITGNMAVTADFTITTGYTLTVNTVGSGTVMKNPDQDDYDYGTMVTLTANPAEGWVFSHWEGDLTGSTNPASISLTGSKTVTAVFTITTGYTLTTTTQGSGTVTKDPDQTGYDYGTVVTITAIPADGWVFDHWTGDVTGNTNPTTIALTGSKSVKAYFTITSGYTLTVNKVGNGNVTKNPDQTSYTWGDIVTLTATPGTGYLFDHWEGDLTGTTSPTTISMTGSKTVTAVFSIITGLTLTISIDGQGSVTKNPDKTGYDYGTVVTITAIPADGWVFDHWSGAATGTTNPTTVTMTSNKAVVAHFTISSGYTLTVTVTGSGSVTKDPNHPTYTYGDPVVLTAYPTYGWKFDHWEGDLTGNTNPQTIYMTGNKAVTAVFTLTDGWKLTIIIDGQGMVTKDPDQATYTFGQDVVLTAMPDAGWLFNEWTGGLTGSQNPATVTMNGDETVTAHFRPNHTPEVPAAPTAPEIAGATVQQTVSAVTTDADGDQILYMFDFGDGTNSSWVGPFASGTPATTTHTWTRDGEFHFKVKAKDTFGHESAWSSATITYMTLTTRMFGSIKQKTTTGNITTFYANFVIFIRPHGGIKILQGMEPIVVPAKHGLVTQSFIMGRFQAALLAPHNIIQGNPTVDDTDLTSLPAGSPTIG